MLTLFDHCVKLEQELLKELAQWEEERGRPFTVEGVRFLDTIHDVIEAEQINKENRKVRCRLLAQETALIFYFISAWTCTHSSTIPASTGVQPCPTRTVSARSCSKPRPSV